MNALPIDRIAKTLPMLGSENDREALAAARALGRILKASGSSFVDLAEQLNSTKATPRVAARRDEPTPYSGGDGGSWYARHRAADINTDFDKARWCADFGGTRLTLKERAFVQDLALRLARYGGEATERQSEWLEAIFARLRRAAA